MVFLFCRLDFATKQGYWYVKQTTVSYDVDVKGVEFKVDNLGLITADISTPLGFSWHCTPKTRFATLGFNFNGTAVNYTNKIIFETNGFQLQPMNVQKDMFGEG